MGFTNVVWAARSTEQLARDLTDGPGPSSVGGAGAAWIRVANELTSVATEFDKLLARLKSVWESQTSTAAAHRLDEFGKWLQAVSLSAAANGQKAEEAAVANTVAIMAMPSVSEAIEAKAAQDMMASLAAYNGAVLTGSFAAFDEAATADQANAAAVMTQYEDAVAPLARPWEQPPPPLLSGGAAAGAAQTGRDAAGARGAGGAAAPAIPLAPMTARGVQSTGEAKLQKTAFTSGAGGTGMAGAPYAPWGAMGRGDQNSRDYESAQPSATLDGAGETAGLSDSGTTWLPAAEQNDSPFTVSSVSWSADTAVFDELATPEQPQQEVFAESGDQTLERVDDRWVPPPVIGVDRGLRL